MAESITDERKTATILFADIAGSTNLIADREVEDALHLLRPMLDLMANAVNRFGGTVNRVTGDGVMALFGAPRSDEEHALGACCAALEMQDVLSRIEAGPRLRVGVHTGDVIIHALRAGAVQTLDAAGASVHLAARLQQDAPPGEVWISGATRHEARGRIMVRDLGARQLRGFSTGTPVHALVMADPSLTRLDAAGHRGLLPFIDRAAERARIDAAYAAASAGQGRALALIGDAGVGKSRLIREFAAGLGSRVRVVQARGIRWRDDSGLHPIRILIRRLLDLADDAQPADFEACFAGADALPAPLRAPLAALLGLPGGGEWQTMPAAQRQARIVEGGIATILWAARSSPLVIVFDDLHWVDSETEAFLARLAAAIGPARLLLLMGWRADYPARWAEGAPVERVRLAPLAPPDAQQLARHALVAVGGDGMAGSAAALARRADGNPYLIEEAANLPAEAPIAANIRALLGARLDRLPAADKQLIETLAAIGEPSTEALIAAASTPPPGAAPLAERLLALERAGYLRIDGIGAARRFACRHGLLQDTAYYGLTERRRRAAHAAIAGGIEQVAGGQAEVEAEFLARHTRLGGLWAANLRYAQIAGDRALARFANREAVLFYDEALAAIEKLPPEARDSGRALALRFALREPLYRLGRIAALRVRLDEAEALATEIGDRRQLGQLRVFQSHHAWLAGDHAAAVAAADRAAAQAVAEGDDALALRAVFQHALGDFGLGDFAACAERMGRVADEAPSAVHTGRYGLDPALAVVAFSYRARALIEAGKLDSAAAAVAACRAEAEGVDRPFSWIFVALAEGRLDHARGDPGAVRRLGEAVELCERAESDLMGVTALSLLAAAELSFGASAEAAVARLETAVTTAQGMGYFFQQPLRLALLAEALRAAGRATEAQARAQAALAMAIAQQEAGSEAYALLALARATGDTARAAAAAILADSRGMAPLAALARAPLPG